MTCSPPGWTAPCLAWQEPSDGGDPPEDDPTDYDPALDLECGDRFTFTFHRHRLPWRPQRVTVTALTAATAWAFFEALYPPRYFVAPRVERRPWRP